MAAEVFLQGFRINVEGTVLESVTLDKLQNLGSDVLCFFPVALIPFLQRFNFISYLNVQFNVLRQARKGKVA